MRRLIRKLLRENLNLPTKEEIERAWENKLNSILPMVKEDIKRFNEIYFKNNPLKFT